MFFVFRQFWIFLLLGLLLAFSAPSFAQDAVNNNLVHSIALLPGIIKKDPNHIIAGLDIQLESRAKTYWRAPGITGEAMTIDWAQSQNVKNLKILWPVPKHFETQAGDDVIDSVGYEGVVLFPLDVEIQNPEKPAHLVLTLNLIVCDKVCVPVQKTVRAKLDAASLQAPAAKLEAAVRELPQRDAAWPRIDRAYLQASKGQSQIIVEGAFVQENTRVFNPALFLEVKDPPEFGPIKLEVGADKNFKALVPIKTLSYDRGKLISQNWLITVTDGVHSTEIVIQPEVGDKKTDDISQKSLGLIVIFAFLGGLILNIMPCVLPVLVLKFLTAMRLSGAAQTQIRRGFAISGLGIVFSFLVLASAAIILKTGNMQLGWGTQFQQPFFLVFMIVVLLFFALNLLGVFHIALPHRWQTALQLRSGQPTKMHHFLDGAFATLLATPCTAPLLGTALGFALAGSVADILCVFTVMGFGFAAPYFAVAAFPRTVELLPKPGRWMKHVKLVMALCLLATALWLGFVLQKTISIQNTQAANVQTDISQQAIQSFIDKDQIVLLDITADWCLTCHFNDITVLKTNEIQQFLKDNNVALMRVDWTKRDDQTAKFLQSMQRAGIPFNVIYSRAARDGIVLNEILTKEAVKNAVLQAKENKAGQSK